MIDNLAAAIEFIARSEPNAELDRWLASRGVDVAHTWNVAGPICAHNVIPWPRGIFNFATPEAEYDCEAEPTTGRANHVRAVVHIARGVNDEMPVDLIAWQPHHPTRIFCYLGEAVMLGASQLGNPASYFANEALLVHRTALDWMVAGCRGIVILNLKKFVIRLSTLPVRTGGYALAAADLAFAKFLRASISSLDRVRVLVALEDDA